MPAGLTQAERRLIANAKKAGGAPTTARSKKLLEKAKKKAKELGNVGTQQDRLDQELRLGLRRGS